MSEALKPVISSPRAVRSKKSDISNFFRRDHATTSNATSLQHPSTSSVTFTPPFPVVSGSPDAPSPKKSKIPGFLGVRARKTSVHSQKSANGVTIAVTPDVKRSGIPQSSAPSLASKFAAAFTPSKPRTSTSSYTNTSKTSVNLTRPIDTTLAPPPSSPRATSFDSGASATSDDRSSTPRPLASPAVTVSLPPSEGLGFDEMFPTAPPAADSTRFPQSGKPPRNDRSVSDETITPRQSSDMLSSPESPKPVIGRPTPLRKGSAGRKDPPAPIIVAPMIVERPSESNSTLVRCSSQTSEQPASSIRPEDKPRSIMKPRKFVAGAKSSIARLPLSGPPQMPLPSPPPGSVNKSFSASQSTGSLPSRAKTTTPNAPKSQALGRPRAQTLYATLDGKSGSQPGTPTSIRSVNSSILSPSPTSSVFGEQNPTVLKVQKSNIIAEDDAEVNTLLENPNATREELQGALQAQKSRFETLTSYLFTLVEKQSAENGDLLKRLEQLEKDKGKMDKELLGFKYLVSQASGAQDGDALADVMPSMASTSRSSIRSKRSTGTSAGQRDSKRDSKASDMSSFYPSSFGVSTRRTSMVDSLSPPVSPVSSRPGSLAVPIGKSALVGYNFGDLGLTYLTNREKRTSSSSFSSSPSSSTSSLPLSNVNLSSSPPGLSAIPELRASSPESSNPAALAEADPPSPTPAASLAYATNLKRGRPPSIAQIMNTHNLDNELEKLRSSESGSHTAG